jgi:transposase
MSSRRKFTSEYKREAIELVKAGNVPASQVARRLGINVSMSGRWRRELQGSVGKVFPAPASLVTRS